MKLVYCLPDTHRSHLDLHGARDVTSGVDRLQRHHLAAVGGNRRVHLRL